MGRKYEAPDRRPRHPLLEPGKFAKTGKDLAGELLMDACYKGDFTAVERLVGQNVDVNYQVRPPAMPQHARLLVHAPARRYVST